MRVLWCVFTSAGLGMIFAIYWFIPPIETNASVQKKHYDSTHDRSAKGCLLKSDCVENMTGS